ncbi:hypothetical protein [Allorhizocola rhizosphaerae]|uniref:hypothetical protein n=1 Tax=Allorhizocola rhizosphaerae TaxID=1872709 RepID=UPI000E3CB9F0|nr:hypothetical protein [Allorhizocola rhizosphaerae]
MDPITLANRIVWEAASQKYVDEYEEHLAQAASGTALIETERRLLREVLDRCPEVVHLQSGHGLDDVALVYAGANPWWASTTAKWPSARRGGGSRVGRSTNPSSRTAS